MLCKTSRHVSEICSTDVLDCPTSAHFVSSADFAPNPNTKNMSYAEMGIMLGGCCWLEHAESTDVCFVLHSGVVSPDKIMKMQYCVKDFSQSDVDLLLAHLTPVTQKVCSCAAGFDLMKLIATRASDRALNEFVGTRVLLDVACTYYGCLLVQFLLHLSKPTVVHVIVQNVFSDKTIFEFLSTHWNANYGVQQAVQEMDNSDFEMSLGTISECASILSTDRHGAFVVQVVLKRFLRMLEKGESTSGMVACVQRILARLISLGDRLVADRYGNFSAQEMIPLLVFDPFLAHKFAMVLSQNFVKYTTNPFGHCVMETLLKRSDIPAARLLVKKFLKLNDHCVGTCVDIEWGRFVVQKLWATASCEDQRQICHKLIKAGYGRMVWFVTSSD